MTSANFGFGTSVFVVELDATAAGIWSKSFDLGLNSGVARLDSVAFSPGRAMVVAGDFAESIDIDGSVFSVNGQRPHRLGLVRDPTGRSDRLRGLGEDVRSYGLRERARGPGKRDRDDDHRAHDAVAVHRRGQWTLVNPGTSTLVIAALAP